MTSATGEALCARRDAGFTLVEVLGVMAIVVLLFSLVAVGVERVRQPCAGASTESLLRRLESTLDDYRTRTGHYPPDGLDYPVANDDGQPLRGAACLYYFLAQKSVVTREIRAGKETFGERQQPIARFSERELTPEDPSAPGVREILDTWGTRLH